MGAQFDKLFNKVVVKEIKKPITSTVIPHQTETPIVVESVQHVKRQKVTLVKPFNPYEDNTALTTENIQTLGFKIAAPEDFIGAKDTTYYLDVLNNTGRTTLVYDFQPIGNQGRPAAHLYYSANTTEISESLVCFSASTTLGEMRQLIEVSKNIKPSTQKNIHDIKQMAELIREAKNSSASDIVV